MDSVDATHTEILKHKMTEERSRVMWVSAWLDKSGTSIHELVESTHEYIMNTIRSALEIYLRDIMKTKAELDITEFDELINEINRTKTLEGLKNAKDDLFDRYYPPFQVGSEAKKVEVFLSYHHEDKGLAGKIRNLLVKKGVDVFLAHEDIEVSDEWRAEILKHLQTCNALVALLTPNFEKSIWANQEVGFVRGRGHKVIPLIVKETDIRRFGFLEALQGITVKEKNLVDYVEEIIRIIIT